MKRSRDDTTSAVYAFGCGEPTSGIEWVMAEHAKQRAMWDALVHADNRAERAIWSSAREVPEIDALISEIDALSGRISEAVKARKAARAKVRAKVDTPEIDAEIATLSDARKPARKALWPLLATWRKENKDTLKAIEQARRDENKAIRQASGLHWGNYNRVIDSFERGRKLAKTRGGRMRFSDPTRTDGVLAVQIQRGPSGLGCSFGEIMAGRIAQIVIHPVPSDIGEHGRSERRKMARTTMSLRVDAAGHRVELPVTIHRLPPPDARIKSAQLTWRMEGERMRWQLALTVSSPTVAIAHDSRKACGVDVGWRKQPDGGLLVATLMNTDGKSRRYALPRAWMTGMDQVERLTEHVDDATLEMAKEWHEQVADLPDDLRRPLMGWRPKLGARHVDCAALHAAIKARIEAVKGTDARADVPASIRHWYDRYRHLLVWRDNLRVKLIRQRREHYRLWAREIASEHALIGVEKIDLAEMARTKTRAPEDGDNPLHQAARAQRQRAAVYSFMQELKHQAAKAGAEIATVDAKYTTMECHKCGERSRQRDRAERIWTCPNGHVWDQDINAARNILSAVTGASGDVMRQAA